MKNPRSFSHSFVSAAAAASLYLAGQPVPAPGAAKTVIANTAMDVVSIVDVSGSMTGDLPTFLRELGNMLPRFLQSGDTFSLIFFSGPAQAGILLDRAEIRQGGQRALDIANIQKTLSTLDTIGLTCFVDPLRIAEQLGERLRTTRPGSRRTLIMGTDGYDNTSPGFSSAERRKNIFAALTAAAGNFDRIVTMGVGWCCDQGILQDMAATVGGQFLFARDIGTFSRDFEAAASRRPVGVKRIKLELDGEPEEGLVFSLGAEGEITQYVVDGGAVEVPESAGTVWFVSKRAVGDILDPVPVIGKRVAAKGKVSAGEAAAIEAGYAALVLFAQRTRRKLVRTIAGGLGDARLVTLANGAFGPQRYTDLAEEAVKAARSEGRYVEGFVAAATVDPHAYTVVQALDALAQGDNRIVPDFPGWRYTAITRARVNAGAVVTAEEAKQIAAMAGVLGTELEAKVLSVLRGIAAGGPADLLDGAALTLTSGAALLAAKAAEVEAMKAAKAPAAPYHYMPAPDGVPVDGIVNASEEANTSLRIVRGCEVDLSAARAALPESIRDKVPATFCTFRYQTYTIITGRILNQPTLPVILDEGTWGIYARAGLVTGPWRAEAVLVDYSKLPLINDGMIEDLSAGKLVQKAYDLEVAKAALKVLRDARKTYVPREDSSAVALWVGTAGIYDGDAEVVKRWLGDIGISDGGFSPSTAGAPTKDKRRSWLLDISIPGLAKLPGVNAVREKLSKIEAWKKTPKGREPKLTASERLLAPTIAKLDAFFAAQGCLPEALLPPAAKPGQEVVVVEEPAAKRLREARIAVLESWLDGEIGKLEPQRKGLLSDLGRAAIVAITGGEWFGDLKPGEKEVAIKIDGETIACTVDVTDVDVDI